MATDKGGAWFTVAGHGAHIRATRDYLTIRRGGREEQIRVNTLDHLIVIGGHTLHTSAVISLSRAGIPISFFDADGKAAGRIALRGDCYQERLREAQRRASKHNYALVFAKAGVDSRILAIERYGHSHGWSLLYEGELDLLQSSREEIQYLVRMEEIRRLHKYLRDMYYEIMARTLPPELGFRRRTERPHRDPVNAMLSFGYAVLFGVAGTMVAAAGLDPCAGVLHDGDDGLIRDIIDGFQPVMVDETVFSMAREGIAETAYEIGERRCYLSDDLIGELLPRLHRSIREEAVAAVVRDYCDALLKGNVFSPVY
ncbi:CRISPR-associated endonuclease Cas1 [Methanofollis fontis]|uniref:CRISPR-associated endonuclease Cas1 n=1 Tax=Methanofollis fontis TaxID=2052832 RepID=A0A483CMR5_9EURY|nr:CRISPR-associated endonuclease Cas1 [Methanofollis fontis]TAJ44177.1 CRISPR-associated endonuclease Cas1 [Methanofollis fontis]